MIRDGMLNKKMILLIERSRYEVISEQDIYLLQDEG